MLAQGLAKAQKFAVHAVGCGYQRIFGAQVTVEQALALAVMQDEQQAYEQAQGKAQQRKPDFETA